MKQEDSGQKNEGQEDEEKSFEEEHISNRRQTRAASGFKNYIMYLY